MLFSQNINRNNKDNKIKLIYADSVIYNQFQYPDATRLSGHVEFQHQGMTMFCDSAVYFEPSNTFKAFRHVRMLQGDTLSIKGDYLFYDGNTMICQIRNNVIMKHRNEILKTDSCNFDRLYNIAYYFDGGELLDAENKLTSDWGEYYLKTKKAKFNYKVKLKNPKFSLVSDTLYYDTNTKWAEVIGPSNIITSENNVYTEHGFYNTKTGISRLVSRSKLYNKINKRLIIGDSIFYNRTTGFIEAKKNVVYKDEKNKNEMFGDYGQYNEHSGTGFVTGRALVKDYSQGSDTMYVHADTLKLKTFNINTDSVYKIVKCYYHVRSWKKDIQMVCDSLVYNTQKHRLSLYKDPIEWSENRQLLGEEMNIFLKDSLIDSIYVQHQALMIEKVDTAYFNQVTGDMMRSYFKNGELYLNRVDGNVQLIFFPQEKDGSVLYSNYSESSRLKAYIENKQMKKLWMPSPIGVFNSVKLLPENKRILSNFTWFDYIRPKGPKDLLKWIPKRKGTELKISPRRSAPLQYIKNKE